MLGIRTAPLTWPIGMGRELRGIYHLLEDRIYVYEAGEKRPGRREPSRSRASRAPGAEFLGDEAQAFDEEIELVSGRHRGLRSGGLPRRPA